MGKTYNTVQIGPQCWFKENLNIGSRIVGTQNQNPTNGIIEKYCYQDKESNCDIYGGLYQWDEMMQGLRTEGTQGICPQGWHIPTFIEWYHLDTTTLNTWARAIHNHGDNIPEHANWDKRTFLPGGARVKNGLFNYIEVGPIFW